MRSHMIFSHNKKLLNQICFSEKFWIFFSLISHFSQYIFLRVFSCENKYYVQIVRSNVKLIRSHKISVVDEISHKISHDD